MSKKPNKRKSTSGKSGGKPKNTRQNRPNKPSKSDNLPDGLIEVTLAAMAYGGSALGRAKGRTVFIPYTIPGEIVAAQVVDSTRTVDHALPVRLLDASADRVYPECPHFGLGKCWGCQWQHIDIDAQRLLKQDVLADQLARLGKFDDNTLDKAMQAVIAAPEQWHYNYHMTLERTPDGTLGLPRMDGRSVEPILDCHIMHPDIYNLYATLDMDLPDVQQLQIMADSTGATMFVFIMNSEEMPSLEADFPTSVNVLLPDNEPVNLVGDTMLHYHIGGRTFRVTAGAYIRPNINQIDALIWQVLDMLDLQDNHKVLDLYAGVGIFSAFIAPRAELVTLVESYPPAATDADMNCADFDNVDVVEGSVEEVLDSLLEAEETYHAAVVDPPGSGLSREALNTLIEMNIPRLVYISSSPPTLARDGQQLARAGYTLRRVQPIDLAPQTYYIDAVALFERKK